MRYSNKIQKITSSLEEAKTLLSHNHILIFLIQTSGKNNITTFLKLSSDSDLELDTPLCIGMYNGVFGSLDSSLAGTSFNTLHYLDDALSRQIGSYLLRELAYTNEATVPNLMGMLSSYADYLLKLSSENRSLQTEFKMGITPFQLKKVKQYILDHIDQTVTIKELSSLVGFSVHHFIRMFKRSTGETPHQLVTRLKMDRAKDLLRYSIEKNILQVGIEVGVENPSHFSQLFKNTYGISPLKFRKSYRTDLQSA